MSTAKMGSASAVVAKSFGSLKLLIFGVIVLLAVGGGIFLSSQGNAPTKESQGTQQDAVFQLSFTDYEGNKVSFADFSGKPLVLNAWAVWCPFCVKELREFVELQQEFPEIVVIAIDRAESRETAKSYTDDLGITKDLVFWLDPSDSFYRTIGGFSMPETLFVDKDGVVQEHKRGPMDVNEMRTRLQKIL